MKIMRHVALAVLLTATTTTEAKDKTPRTYVVNNEDVGVPVFPYDITDRPYTVVGEVKAGVRKATVFSKEASQAKVYRELWERADKMGADAVINAKYGDSHITLTGWGKTNATGTAIRFTTSGTTPASTAPAPQQSAQ